mmetsp:Transcript_67755/g.107359  ORF Transcript_67755/g.107359 Transcript_67755/m.107359 type:complete len:145 (+) Transcript_67755:55-489(+)
MGQSFPLPSCKRGARTICASDFNTNLQLDHARLFKSLLEGHPVSLVADNRCSIPATAHLHRDFVTLSFIRCDTVKQCQLRIDALATIRPEQELIDQFDEFLDRYSATLKPQHGDPVCLRFDSGLERDAFICCISMIAQQRGLAV